MSFHSMRVSSEKPKCYIKFKDGHMCLDDIEKIKSETAGSDWYLHCNRTYDRMCDYLGREYSDKIRGSWKTPSLKIEADESAKKTIKECW